MIYIAIAVVCSILGYVAGLVASAMEERPPKCSRGPCGRSCGMPKR